MPSDTIWQQEHLCTIPRVDPNELALAEFRAFLAEHGITRYGTDTQHKTKHVWFTFSGPDYEIYKAKAALVRVHWQTHIMFTEYCRVLFRRHFCRHCSCSWDDHVDGKCLFQSTSFEADWA